MISLYFFSSPYSSCINLPSSLNFHLFFVLLTTLALLIFPNFTLETQYQQKYDDDNFDHSSSSSAEEKRSDSKAAVCANSGNFLHAYCLADYNCNIGNNRRQQVCIRGLCCSRTRVRKSAVNIRRAEDRRRCPSAADTFSVGLRCASTRDCARRRQKATSSSPLLPILVCSRHGWCCTNGRQYRKPLGRGDVCLNGGRALGVGRPCLRDKECRRRRRRPSISRRRRKDEITSVCVDGECCTKAKGRRKTTTAAAYDDLDDDNVDIDDDENSLEDDEDKDIRRKGDGSESEEEEEEEEWDSAEHLDWENESQRDSSNSLPNDDNWANYDNGENDDGENTAERILDGRRVCNAHGLRYNEVRRCSRGTMSVMMADCGAPRQFRCISGYCCERRGGGAEAGVFNANGRRRQYDDQRQQGQDEEDDATTNVWSRTGRLEDDRRRIPAGPLGYCAGRHKFQRFLGHSCDRPSDCPIAVDALRRKAKVRCIRGACCANLRPRGGGRRQNDWRAKRGGGRGRLADQDEEGRERRNDGQNGGGGPLIPVRPSGLKAICFDGSPSSRQCITALDCLQSSFSFGASGTGQHNQCVNQLCCPPAQDQQHYACGGVGGTGQCSLAQVQAGDQCSNGLYCNSPGVCCECPVGQPQQQQMGRGDCRRGGGKCISGFQCDRNTGFCCPRCAQGRIPFGSCFRGKCADGFECVPGNICCARLASDGGKMNWQEYRG